MRPLSGRQLPILKIQPNRGPCRLWQHQWRQFSRTVYQVPADVRKMVSVMPHKHAFASNTAQFTLPFHIKADLTEAAINEWMTLDNHKRRHFRANEYSYVPPAMIRWFMKTNRKGHPHVRFSAIFDRIASNCETRYPMELIRPARHKPIWDMRGKPPRTPELDINESFENRDLHLMALSQAFNMPYAPPFSIYMAQVPIQDLPAQLRSDLPNPYLLEGDATDIYSANVWMGSEPTFTSIHCDPEPNYFMQLCGRKYVRLLRPPLGEHLFQVTRSRIGSTTYPRIRGHEMMVGHLKQELENEIWGDWLEETPIPGRPLNSPDDSVLATDTIERAQLRLLMKEDFIWEAALNPGDALFIPAGWWHSMRSENADGRLNASANWWFRYRTAIMSPDGPSGPHSIHALHNPKQTYQEKKEDIEKSWRDQPHPTKASHKTNSLNWLNNEMSGPLEVDNEFDLKGRRKESHDTKIDRSQRRKVKLMGNGPLIYV